MFAIAIWNNARQQLFLARESFRRQCYAHMSSRAAALRLPPEIKSLLALPDFSPPNLEALHQYLRFMGFPDPLMTMFEGVVAARPTAPYFSTWPAPDHAVWDPDLPPTCDHHFRARR